MEMAKIGGTPKGGCKRLTLTDLDKQGRELVPRLVREGGLHDQGRRDGQHVRAPRGRRGRSAARADGQPSRHPADRGQVRRRARRARRAGSGALAQRPQDQDPAADRSRQLDQRGGLALRPAMVSSGVFAGVYTKELAYSRARRRGQDARRRTGADRLQGRRTGRRAGRSTPRSNCISSRGRSSRTRSSTSASSPTARASAGTKSA